MSTFLSPLSSQTAAMMLNVRVRAVLFDLDDSLVPEAPALEAGYAAVAERIWGCSSKERIRSLDSSARAFFAAHAPHQGYLAQVCIGMADCLHGDLVAATPQADDVRRFLPEFQRNAFAAVLPPGWRSSPATLVEIWREARVEALDVYEETVEVLRQLRAVVPLVLVTNGPSNLQRLKLTRTGLRPYFDFVIVSEDIGVGKPDAAMFDAAMTAVGLRAADLVMVGNDLERDIQAARQVGIQAIWIQREGLAPEAIRDLRELPIMLEPGP